MQTRFKICFISSKTYPLFNPQCQVTFGGAEVQLYLLAKELAKDPGLDVNFIVANFGQKDVEEYDGVKVYKAFTLRRKLKYIHGIPAVLKLIKVLKKINADIYIQRSAGVETGIIALFCRLFRKKFIYMTASRIECDGHFFQKMSTLISRIHLYGMQHADRVITQGVEDAELLKRTFGIESVVLRNSFPIQARNDSNGTQKKHILWISSCQQLKQPGLFLKMAQRFPSEQFMMVLSSHSYHLKLYEDIRKQTQTISNIGLVGRVPFDEADTYYQHAKLFINTSTYEGFPNTFVQAAKNKTPIISLNVNPDNFLNEYQCGFCAEGSFERMVEYVRLLLNNNTLWRKISENAYRYAKENHDIKKNIAVLKQILQI